MSKEAIGKVNPPCRLQWVKWVIMVRVKAGIVDIEGKRAELAAIPKGCISHKRINGKVYCYRQWTEGGKTRSDGTSLETS